MGDRPGRPAMLPVPAIAIKKVFGELEEASTCAQRALPPVLQDAGFHFSYGDIDSALGEIVQ